MTSDIVDLASQKTTVVASSPTGALFKHLHFVPFQIFICDGLDIISVEYHRMSGLIPDIRFHIFDKKTTVCLKSPILVLLLTIYKTAKLLGHIVYSLFRSRTPWLADRPLPVLHDPDLQEPDQGNPPI